MLLVRAAFALFVTGFAAWLLTEGLPLAALVVVVLAVWARRAVESGRSSRLARPL